MTLVGPAWAVVGATARNAAAATPSVATPAIPRRNRDLFTVTVSFQRKAKTIASASPARCRPAAVTLACSGEPDRCAERTGSEGLLACRQTIHFTGGGGRPSAERDARRRRLPKANGGTTTTASNKTSGKATPTALLDRSYATGAAFRHFPLPPPAEIVASPAAAPVAAAATSFDPEAAAALAADAPSASGASEAIPSNGSVGPAPPMFPRNLGFAQLSGVSCSAGAPRIRPIELAISCERLAGKGEYPMSAMCTCPSQAMYRIHAANVSLMPEFV